MCYIFREIILNYFLNIDSGFLTSMITLLGVFITVWCTKKDTDRMIQQAKEDTDRTLKASEKSSKEFLRASVKPLLYSLDDVKNFEKIVEFSSEDTGVSTFPMKSYIKNSNIGVAVIKKITIGKIDYIPKIDCVIDKGTIIKIKLNTLDKSVDTLNGTMYVYDIYGNLYSYLITIYGDKFSTNNSTLMNNLQQKAKNDVNVKTGNISNSVVAVGDNINANNMQTKEE